jgi:hypothetical protein
VLEEARRHQIKVIAYYSLGTDAYAVKENPDWYQVDEHGKVRGEAGTVWELPCLNSPYREELVIPQIREITERYDMDGYLFDIPYHSHHTCFCTYCKKKFSEEYGMPLTPELFARNPGLVRQFNIDTAAGCMQELHDLVKSIRPHVLINCNGAWRMGEPASINATSDYGLWESQPASGTFLCHSIKARYTRNLPVPVQIMTVRFTEDWGLMSCKTAEQLKYEFASILANAGTINIGDQVMPNGELQSGVYDVIGEAFRFVEEREVYSIGAVSVPHIAVISDNTSNWYWEKDDPALLGTAKMLIEGHHQFDIFYNDQFPELHAFQTVILTESAKLSSESLERIRSFVKGGGLLIAAGEVTLSQESRNFLLSDVLGINYLERTPYPFGYMMENDDLWAGVPRIPQLVEAGFLKVIATTARTLSGLQWPLTVPAPQRAFRHPLPPPGKVSGFPAITVNDYGRGKAIYIAVPIFGTYWKTNHYWLRKIFNNMLNGLETSKPFTIEAPPQVEANLLHKDGKGLLHLVHFQNNHTGDRSSCPYDPIEEIWPIHNLKVTLPASKPLTQAVLQPDGHELEIKRTTGGYEVLIPKLHIHAVIELTYT